MYPEDRLLLACTRQDFSATYIKAVQKLCHTTSINWDYVFTTAQQHGVAPLVHTNLSYPALQQLAIPSTVRTNFENACYRNVVAKAMLARELGKLLHHFQQRSIDVLLIKGSALDLVVYAQPWYTVHDVDLVLRPSNAEISEQEQREIGWLFPSATGFEYDFFHHHDVTINGVLPVDFGEIWRDARPISFQKEPVWVMCPEDLLLTACINSCRKRFFRLKSLLDIAEITKSYTDLNWPAFIDKAHLYDCRTIVYAALLVADQCVGCRLPDNLLAQLQITPWRATLIGQLVQRLSLSAFSARQQGLALFNRFVDWPLILLYLTFEWYQIGRRLRFVWQTRNRG